MKPLGIVRISWLANLLTVTVCLGIIALMAFGYRSTREWQRSSALLIQKQTEEGANLLVTAVTRDMRGAQSSVLADRDWGDLSVGPPHDAIDLVAAAFARYPYPESFFSWNELGSRGISVFNRADRPPPWMATVSTASGYPVVLVDNPPDAVPIRSRVEQLAANHDRYAVFDLTLAGQPYQVVARLSYQEAQPDHLQSVTGFTVNLDWVRQFYFSDIVSQVTNIVRSAQEFSLAVVDDQGRRISGRESRYPAAERAFPLLFFDTSITSIDSETGVAVHNWKVRASVAEDSTFLQATKRADWLVSIAGAGVFILAISLVVVARTARASAALAEMRSDFVSSATHGLRTPVASIRMLAETLARNRQIGTSGALREYVDLITQETKRLMRRVENLLTYARVTDVGEIYSFEPVVPGEIVDDVLKDFRQQLREKQFAVSVDVSPDLPLVRGDYRALFLALSNLVDNSIRYSADKKSIVVTAQSRDSVVAIEVRDYGIGIPAEELSTVRRKFARGRFAHSDGSGLGLAIVSRIVADHAGSFVLESEVGIGTTARVLLPVVGL